MTREIVEFYKTLVARDRSHPSKPPDPPTSIAQNSRFSRLLVSYSQKQFTGAIEIASPNGREWNIHYRLGRMIWASGGYHPLRRWRRSLHQFDAAIDFQALKGTDRTCPHTPLEYQLLGIAIQQKRLTRQQAKNIIDRVIRDAIFDIIQEEAKRSLQYRLQSKDTVGHISILLNSEFVLWQVIQDWQAWCRADLAAYSPNYAPKLRQSERFARVLSPASYRQMENLMSGRHSVRDLAVRLERDPIAFTQSLMPYLRQGAIELIEIPDEPMEWLASPH